MAKIHKRQFGDALIEAGLLTQDKLREALEIQKKEGDTLGFTLLKMGALSEIALVQFFKDQLGLEYANLQNYVSDSQITRFIPQNIAVKYQVVPLLKVKNVLTIAMVDPLDSFVLDVLAESTNCEIKPLISTWSEVKNAIELAYKRKQDEEEASLIGETSLQFLQRSLEKPENNFVDIANVDGTDKNSIINLINLILLRAVELKASDVHIEPDEGKMRIRYRVDGLLVEVMSLPKDVEAAVSSRCKVMSDLDIAEKRVPQDGRVKVDLAGRKVDLRVSSYPTLRGEKIVMRILDTKNVLWGLKELGFPRDTLEKFVEVIQKPNGIILVTGPTGSGKSSTLYASLAIINKPSINIVTLEDPVEYQMANINQGQVNVKAGFTFPNGLRSILRQDPDVIMVGEIRDLETAEISIRAALTGHLVFSTLHTNDAPGAITRLIDMGIEPFLVASSVIGVLAQRLLRMICQDCRKEVVPDAALIKRARIVYKPGQTHMFFGEGCDKCQFTGYKGRSAIVEFFIPSEKIKSMIIAKEPSSVLKDSAIKNKMRTLRQDGLIRVLQGVTTLEEVLRVSQEDEI